MPMLAKVAALETVLVPKPWGREEWYSGVEARGESRVRVAGQALPLSAFLAAHGRSAPIVLLKLLRPTAGDLYIEVHETKHEVYVVDAVDAEQWTDAGGMLLGVDRAARDALGERGFVESLRRRAQEAEAGGRGTADVAALLELVALRSGDVVVIPPGVPHSLLRGVQVVEFQTPVFERRILAARGPVVTQKGWDVAEALAALDLHERPVVSRCAASNTELVAETPTFGVVRLIDDAYRTVPPWSVGWVAAGSLLVGECHFRARQAFVTAGAARVRGTAGTVAFVAVEGEHNQDTLGAPLRGAFDSLKEDS